jgi:IMP dehydrogenase
MKLEIPVFSANMDTITGYFMARKMYELGGLGFLHRFCSIDDNINMYESAVLEWQNTQTPRKQECEAVVSLGVNEGLERFLPLYGRGARYFCIDVAHGHSKAVGNMIKAVKEFEDVYVIAGNVCTAEGAEYLASCGADAIKIGIGPGSVCTTRVKTGFGVPQFSALMDCQQVQCFLIADGGIKTPGDAVKAFVAGAYAVMLGGMLAGTNETPGDVVFPNGYVDGMPLGHGHKVFRGMASREAQEDFMGSQAEWKTAEGIEISIDHKGPVKNIIDDLMGGLRSGMTYCGANNIKQIEERGRWREISDAGRYEGTPHGRGRL